MLRCNIACELPCASASITIWRAWFFYRLSPVRFGASKRATRCRPNSPLTKSCSSDSVALLSLRANQRWRWDDLALCRMT